MQENLELGRVAVVNEEISDGLASGSATGPGLSIQWGLGGATELEVAQALLARMRFLSRLSGESVQDELAVNHLESVVQWIERRGSALLSGVPEG